jgi:hypothetical protein
MNNTHHGQLIEKIIRRNGHSITDIARLTHVNRRSVYNWFNQARLKPRTIKSIGEAIQYDFAGIFPELEQEVRNEITSTPVISPSRALSYADNVDNGSYHWKDKYIDLLERHAKLLSQIGA